LLDYNSLDLSSGPIRFIDGMTKIQFKGKKHNDKNVELKRKSRKDEPSCFGFLSKNVIKISTEETEVIPINSIEGLIIGPQSLTFKQYLRENFLSSFLARIKYD